MKLATAGETVLLKEGTTLRWVRVVHTNAPRANGHQCITIQPVDQYGRAKPRRVVLDQSNVRIEWAS